MQSIWGLFPSPRGGGLSRMHDGQDMTGVREEAHLAARRR